MSHTSTPPNNEFGIPNEVIFGPNPRPNGNNLTWGDMRSMLDDSGKIEALASRVQNYLIDGIVNSARSAQPFAAASLILVGIGSLGEIFFNLISEAKAEDANKTRFCSACNKLDQKLSRQLGKQKREAFAKRWGLIPPNSASEILYRFFRNSIIHRLLWQRRLFDWR